MNNKRYLSRVLSAIGLMLVLGTPVSAFGFSTHTEEWSEEALLHDGRIIKVDREVYWMFHFISGDEASLRVMESDPDRYGIKFKNPDTGETIKWDGEEGFSPVLLDIVDKVPYLVVQGPYIQAYFANYSCPEVPYIFLKHEGGFFSGKWVRILPKQFPGKSKVGNLSPATPSDIEDYGQAAKGGKAMMEYVYKPKRFLSHADIAASIKYWEGHSAGQIHALIPTECPVWEKPTPIVLPAASNVRLEILESKEYSPEKSFAPEIMFDKEKTANCGSLIRPEDPRNPNMVGRYVFVKDTSRLNKIQFKPFAFPSFNMVCDGENVWFPEYGNNGEIELTKRSNSGELKYRVTFQIPFPAYIVFSSVHSRDGYLYFDLWDSHNDAQGGHLKRALKARLLEPVDKRTDPVKIVR
jgi:hypothetical protein